GGVEDLRLRDEAAVPGQLLYPAVAIVGDVQRLARWRRHAPARPRASTRGLGFARRDQRQSLRPRDLARPAARAGHDLRPSAVQREALDAVVARVGDVDVGAPDRDAAAGRHVRPDAGAEVELADTPPVA